MNTNLSNKSEDFKLGLIAAHMHPDPEFCVAEIASVWGGIPGCLYEWCLMWNDDGEILVILYSEEDQIITTEIAVTSDDKQEVTEAVLMTLSFGGDEPDYLTCHIVFGIGTDLHTNPKYFDEKVLRKWLEKAK